MSRRIGQWAYRVQANDIPAASTVKPAAAAPMAGWASCARITEAISRTNHPNSLAQCGRVDQPDEPAADQHADHRGGGDQAGQPPVDLLAGQVPGEAGERLHRDDYQRGSHRSGHREPTDQGEGGDQKEAAAGADQSAGQPDPDALAARS